MNYPCTQRFSPFFFINRAKLFLALLMTVVASLTAPATNAQADNIIFQAGTTFDVTGTSRLIGVPDSSDARPTETILRGDVFLSHQGQIKVFWDKASLNLGRFAIGTDGTRSLIQATLPSLSLDLQALLGERWMDSIQLIAAGGTIDQDATRATTDIILGTIGLSLTQSLHKTQGIQWTLNETAGGATYFSRRPFGTDQAVEVLPVQFTLNTTIVAKLSQSIAVALAIGAYANVIRGIGQSHGYEGGIFGGSIAPSVNIGQRISTGLRVDEGTNVAFSSAHPSLQMGQVTSFVKYALSKKDSIQQAIELSIGSLYNETVVDASGRTLSAKFARLKYTVVF